MSMASNPLMTSDLETIKSIYITLIVNQEIILSKCMAKYLTKF